MTSRTVSSAELLFKTSNGLEKDSHSESIRFKHQWEGPWWHQAHRLSRLYSSSISHTRMWIQVYTCSQIAGENLSQPKSGTPSELYYPSL